MRRAGMVVAALMVGALVGSALPVGAHHRESNQKLREQLSDVRFRLRQVERDTTNQSNRIAELNGRVGSVEASVSSLGSRVSSLESRASSVESKVRALEGKTSRLSSSGYLDPRYITVPFFCSGEVAVWDFSGLRC